mmetsp:Transcript_22220/g.51782  ORF Transcript_22220/g.51782 Transcript_22220/m.51782 type:complete len:359 (+) Transcript_22220:148-1224(+)
MATQTNGSGSPMVARRVNSNNLADKSPMVARRVNSTNLADRGPGACKTGAAAPPPPPTSTSSPSQPSSQPRLKPSVRQTIESMVSTGSQAEFFKPEQTIILYDWDDTLCPSNWIRKNRPELSFFKAAPLDERYQRPLRELQLEVEAVLKLSMKMGKVIIVTNAMEPWVETSCRNFLPKLLPLVSELPVIYARSIFDAHGCEVRTPKQQAMPGMYNAFGQSKLLETCNQRLMRQDDQFRGEQQVQPQLWKELAFEQEIAGFYSRYAHQSWKNVISIGDSIFERDAVRRVILNRPTHQKKCRTKTAKLLDEPAIDELIAQVRVIHESIGMMVQYDGNLDIEIDEDDLKLELPLADRLMDR